MSKYYNPKKTRGLYQPNSDKPFTISRTGLDLFIECPRCFYIDKRLGTGRPSGYPFNLNIAVDTLLKKEFDIHRAQQTTHPLMKTYGIDAVPFPHNDLEVWRDSRTRGIKYLDKNTNLIIRGGIDDIWKNPKGEVHIVDYKATAKNEEVNLDADWQIGYKRQIEVYQWLFRKNNFNVSNIGYFVYCNGQTDKKSFDGKLEFDVKIISYHGNDSWVDDAIKAAKKCLDNPSLPKSGADCVYCAYYNTRNSLEKSV